LKKEFQNLYSRVSFKLQLIIRPKWIDTFYHSCAGSSQIVYHGTNSKNDRSICDRGLIVGGTKGVPITHGSSYGHGIYCSPALSRASSYSQGSIYICLTHNAQKNGDIWVVPHEHQILPCFLLSYQGSLSTSCGSFYLQGNTVWKFIPKFKPLNKKSIYRKIQRKMVFKKYH